MDTISTGIEMTTMSEILNLASWNRQRTSEELQSFIRTRHSSLPDDSEIE